MSSMRAPFHLREELPIKVRANVSMPNDGPDDMDPLTEEELWEAWNAGEPDVESLSEDELQAAWDAAFGAP